MTLLGLLFVVVFDMFSVDLAIRRRIELVRLLGIIGRVEFLLDALLSSVFLRNRFLAILNCDWLGPAKCSSASSTYSSVDSPVTRVLNAGFEMKLRFSVLIEPVGGASETFSDVSFVLKDDVTPSSSSNTSDWDLVLSFLTNSCRKDSRWFLLVTRFSGPLIRRWLRIRSRTFGSIASNVSSSLPSLLRINSFSNELRSLCVSANIIFELKPARFVCASRLSAESIDVSRGKIAVFRLKLSALAFTVFSKLLVTGTRDTRCWEFSVEYARLCLWPKTPPRFAGANKEDVFLWVYSKSGCPEMGRSKLSSTDFPANFWEDRACLSWYLVNKR